MGFALDVAALEIDSRVRHACLGVGECWQHAVAKVKGHNEKLVLVPRHVLLKAVFGIGGEDVRGKQTTHNSDGRFKYLDAHRLVEGDSVDHLLDRGCKALMIRKDDKGVQSIDESQAVISTDVVSGDICWTGVVMTLTCARQGQQLVLERL